MCFSQSGSRSGEAALSRLGVAWGIAALVTMLTAFVSSSWLYTREPVTLPNSDITTTVGFRIGLWRICPSVRRVNASIHMPSPACSLVSYSGWEDVRHGDLGIWMPLEFAPSFVSRMRVSTLFEGGSVLLILVGTVFALMGHCNGDHKTLIACGLFILAGLSLGSGLVVFATALSDTYVEATADRRRLLLLPPPASHPLHHSPAFDYKYGWSFFAAIAAFIMAELAALFSMSAYLRRFPTVEDMVREMVPGAERKLREHQRLSSQYLLRHSGPLPVKRPPHNKQAPPPLPAATPPDVCSTGEPISLMILDPPPPPPPFAGQTVPITIKRARPLKYGTLPHACSAPAPNAARERAAATLQHPRHAAAAAKKPVTIGTFQMVDGGREPGYPGSAV